MKNGHPRFVTAGPMGAAMQLEPPFDFDGVTLRVFPLRARLHQLQRFVDDYLNLVPPQVARFRVPLPYAFLALINYGKMAVDAANMGWIAQREILFCVPLEWYRLEAGRYVFQGWAFVSPFIYVDNELSMATGRNVYGWPKSLATLDPELSAWMESPRARTRLATASTMVFPKAYEGYRQEQRVFLEVTQGLGPSPFQVPPDLGGPAMPWVAIPNAVRSSADLLRDSLGLFGAMGLTERQPYVGPSAYAAMARQIGRDANPFGPDLAFNTINLKQFRSADNPSAVCYQALTNARMEMKAYKHGGLLGDGSVLLGDSSGGFRVLLHRYEATPIIDTLGLEVEAEWEGPGATVASLKPVLPYWLDLDMRYHKGETLAWRTKVTDGWKVGAGDGAKRYAKDVPARPPGPTVNPYNTTTAGASQGIGGALTFPDSTFRVLPLLADPTRLEAFLQGYLNEPLASEGMCFEPWGRYVYLVLGNHNGVASETNNVGGWADYDVKILVAVKWYDVDPATTERTLRGVALVPAFAYANSTMATITSTEVTGIPMMKAVIESPPGTWLADSGPGDATTDPLVRLTTPVLPVLGEGQGAEPRVVLEVSEGAIPGLDDEAAWRQVADTWGNALRTEFVRASKIQAVHPKEYDAALDLTLEIVGHGLPINFLTLKQFREAGEPAAACYQSLILHRWQVEHVRDLREIEGPLYACIHEYPTQPIVKTLGLVAKRVCLDGAAQAYYLEPVRPFWVRVSMKQPLGLTLRRRAGSEAWEKDPDTEALRYPHFFREAPRVEAGLSDRVFPQGIRAQVQGDIPVGVPVGAYGPGLEGDGVVAVKKLTREEAMAAVEAIDPQTILGAMLSREWEHHGQPRWLKERERIEQELDQSTRDDLPEEVARTQRNLLLHRVVRCNLAGSYEGGATLASHRRRRNELFAGLKRVTASLTRLSQAQRPTVDVRDPLGDGASPRPEVDGPGPELNHADADLVREVVFVAGDDRLYRRAMRVLHDLRRETHAEAGHPEVARRRERLLEEARRRIGATAPGDREGILDPRERRVETMLGLLLALPMRVQRRLRAMEIEAEKAAFDRCRALLVHELALAAQKPDRCVRRDTLEGAAREAMMPYAECWAAETPLWFVGPRAPAASPQPLAFATHHDTAPAPSTYAFDDGEKARDLGSIRHLSVWADEVIHAVQAEYALRPLRKHGGDEGTRHTVDLHRGERLVGVKGSSGEHFGARHLFGLTLTLQRVDASSGQAVTRTREVGPFGSGARVVGETTPFAIVAPEGQEIAALSGRSYMHADGTESLTALGAWFGQVVATRR